MARGHGVKAMAILVAAMGLAGAGCSAGRATRIGTGDGGGSVMLNGNNEQAWAQAQRLMAADCEGGYVVVRRGAATGGVPDARGAVPVAATATGPMDMGLGPAYGERVDYRCVASGGAMTFPLPAPRLPTAPVAGPVAPAMAL